MKPSAEKFVKQINLLNHANPEALAHTYGVALYEPFTPNDTHDPLIVEMKPYGHYTFIDGTKVGLSYVGGSFYAYIAQDPSFNNSKRFVPPAAWTGRKRPSPTRRGVSPVNAQPEIEPISPWGSMGSAAAFTTPSSR
jgi:hypothetical protein